MANLHAKRARRDKAASIQPDAEMAEICRCAFCGAEIEARCASGQLEIVIEAFARHEIAFDRDIDLDGHGQRLGE